MYCNTLVCIAEERAETVSQYSLVYYGRNAGWGKNCIAIQKLYFDSRDSGLLDCFVTQGCDMASQATIWQGREAGGAPLPAGSRQGARGSRRSGWQTPRARGKGARHGAGCAACARRLG